MPTSNLGTWNNWTGSYTAIDDLYVRSSSAADYAYTTGIFVESNAWYGITDMPSDFAFMNQLYAGVQISAARIKDDTITLYARMYRGDQATPLTDALSLGTYTVANNGVWSVSSLLPFTGVVAGSKAIWDAAVLRIYAAYTTIADEDEAELRLAAINLYPVYLPHKTISGVDALAIASVESPSIVRGPKSRVSALTITVAAESRTIRPTRQYPDEVRLQFD